MKLVNLTPHPVVLCDTEGRPVIIIAPSGIIARCSAERQVVESCELEDLVVPVTVVVMGLLEGLPAPADNTLYVASRIACEGAKVLGRTDVVCPDDAVRDQGGRIIGVKALSRV